MVREKDIAPKKKSETSLNCLKLSAFQRKWKSESQFLRIPSDDMHVGESSGRTRAACSTRNRKSQDPLKEGVVILTEPLLTTGFQTKDQD